MDAALAYFHYLAIFSLTALLFAELLLLRPAMVSVAGLLLARIDMAFGIASGAVLASGLLRAFYGVKGLAFYLHNPVFHAKVTLFVIVGILSIWPTLMFIRWGRHLRRDAAYVVPAAEIKRARRYLMIELHLLLLLPLLAVLMSRGQFLRAA